MLDNLKLETFARGLKVEGETSNLKLETRNPKLETRNSNFAMSKLLNAQSSFVPRKFLLIRLRQ